MKAKKSFYVQVITPWGTETSYMLSKDLQQAIRYDKNHHMQSINWIGSLINVPIFEWEWQKHYHPLIIPCYVLNSFTLRETNDWRTRSQFITHSNLIWDSKDQLKYLKHNYSLVNQKLIEKAYNFWKSVINQ